MPSLIGCNFTIYRLDIWERFTEFHLKPVMHHPAIGCSYFECKRSPAGKPSVQNYHGVTQLQVFFTYYQATGLHGPERIALLILV